MIVVLWGWWQGPRWADGMRPRSGFATSVRDPREAALAEALPGILPARPATSGWDRTVQTDRILAADAPVPHPVNSVNSEAGPGWVARSDRYPRPAQTVLEMQVALARQVLSPGSIDGVWGPSTRRAFQAFQELQGLPASGEPDPISRQRLLLNRPALKWYEVGPSDWKDLTTLGESWWEKARQPMLNHETLLERVGEKHHASPTLLEEINPGVDWNARIPGWRIRVPDVDYPAQPPPAALIRIRLSERWLRAYDGSGRLLAHFPCSIARHAEKRPVGRLRVINVVELPNYTFNPDMFDDSEEARTLGRKLILQPGPNNPVGLAWIGLDQPGYGIHGTPCPERVGRTESRGCFRLTNWDALHLLRMVQVGTPVEVEP